MFIVSVCWGVWKHFLPLCFELHSHGMMSDCVCELTLEIYTIKSITVSPWIWKNRWYNWNHKCLEDPWDRQFYDSLNVLWGAMFQFGTFVQELSRYVDSCSIFMLYVFSCCYFVLNMCCRHILCRTENRNADCFINVELEKLYPAHDSVKDNTACSFRPLLPIICFSALSPQ